jgi:hypothetical protein
VLRKLHRRVERLHHYIYLRTLLKPPPYPGVKLTPKRMTNLWRSRIEGMLGRAKLRSLPIRLTVEAANACNLSCPACFTGLGETNGRRKSLMTLELYRRLLDELGDYLFEMEFYSWGEPLLSKFIFEMIGDATAGGISTTISSNFSIRGRRQGGAAGKSGLYAWASRSMAPRRSATRSIAARGTSRPCCATAAWSPRPRRSSARRRRT